jgi:uncharacterized membrane protein
MKRLFKQSLQRGMKLIVFQTHVVSLAVLEMINQKEYLCWRHITREFLNFHSPLFLLEISNMLCTLFLKERIREPRACHLFLPPLTRYVWKSISLYHCELKIWRKQRSELPRNVTLCQLFLTSCGLYVIITQCSDHGCRQCSDHGCRQWCWFTRLQYA